MTSKRMTANQTTVENRFIRLFLAQLCRNFFVSC